MGVAHVGRAAQRAVHVAHKVGVVVNSSHALPLLQRVVVDDLIRVREAFPRLVDGGLPHEVKTLEWEWCEGQGSGEVE